MVRPRPEQKAGGEENLLEGNSVCQSPLGRQGPRFVGSGHLGTRGSAVRPAPESSLSGVNVGPSETVGATEGCGGEMPTSRPDAELS